MTTKRYLPAIIVAAVLLGACADDSGPTGVEPTPVTGTATFAVATAPEFLGAIRLRVVGSGISSPTARGSATVMGQRTVGDTTTFLVSVTRDGGAFLNVILADRSRIPTAVVQEATAGRLDGYRAIVPSAVIVSTTVQ